MRGVWPSPSHYYSACSSLPPSPSLHFSLSLSSYSCRGCKVQPIDGPRYHCQVCGDFDFCQNCFEREQSHNHAFERIDDQGQPAVYVGSPHSRRKALKRYVHSTLNTLIIFIKENVAIYSHPINSLKLRNCVGLCTYMYH